MASENKALQATPSAGALAALAVVPEPDIWLAGLRSLATRRAYRDDVAEFLAFYAIKSMAELPTVTPMAVIAWRLHLEERKHKAATIRRKLAALSSLFAHLVERHIVGVNPVRDIARPRLNRTTGTTPAFSKAHARKLLAAPPRDTLLGLRDRAILAVGLQVGARRSEIVHLRVRDLHQSDGYDCLRLLMKGGTDNVVPIHKAAAQRLHEYLAAAGHAEDLDGPLFRPVRSGPQAHDPRRHLEPQMVDIIVKKYARQLGLPRGYSAHSMRATFITTTLANGASLEEVQRHVGHAQPSTTKLYDRRGANPERSPSFFANY